MNVLTPHWSECLQNQISAVYYCWFTFLHIHTSYKIPFTATLPGPLPYICLMHIFKLHSRLDRKPFVEQNIGVVFLLELLESGKVGSEQYFCRAASISDSKFFIRGYETRSKDRTSESRMEYVLTIVSVDLGLSLTRWRTPDGGT